MDYEREQRALVARLNRECREGWYSGEVAASPADFEADQRVFLAIVAVPPIGVLEQIRSNQRRLAALHDRAYRVPERAWHLTIKSVRTISDPPSFTEDQAELVLGMMDRVVPRHRPISLRLTEVLCTPTSAGIAAFSGPELGRLVADLDCGLREVGVPDNKRHASTGVHFTNLTLLRFAAIPTDWDRLTCEPVEPVELEVTQVQLVSANLAYSPGRTVVHGRVELGSTGMANGSDRERT
ncbi:MAG: hypothetical protein KF745_02840 [Phycisphaeraceae bacterium]|nr:hypothetical protein [Phycisphaeraceae bacterium]